MPGSWQTWAVLGSLAITAGIAAIVLVRLWTPPESTVRYGLNLAGYCQQKFGPTATVTTDRSDAYSWRCKLAEQSYRIDMNDACEMEHGSAYKARLGDRKDSYTWTCQPGQR